jgi:hypothetical protein
MKYARFFIACLIVLCGARVWAISIWFPDTSLATGIKGSTLVIPLIVDSITTADSIGGFDIRITCDTSRIRPYQVTADGTIVGRNDRFSVGWEQGSSGRGGFRFWALGDGIATLEGRGVILLVWFQVMNDSAGTSPLGFVQGQVQFNQFRGPLPVVIDVGKSDGAVRFFPTVGLRCDSLARATQADTVVMSNVILENVRGDGIRSLHVRFASSDTALLIVDIDTLGTLAGSATSVSARQQGGGSDMVVDVEGLTPTTTQEGILLRLKLRARCIDKKPYTAMVAADSLTVTGVAAKFWTSAAPAKIEIACTAVFVRETKAGKIGGYSIFPNPSATEIRVARSKGVGGSIELIDVTGRALRHSSMAGATEIRFSVVGLANGVYGVREVTTARLLGTVVVDR